MTRVRSLFSLLACLGIVIVYLSSPGSAAERRCACRYAGQSYPVGTCICMKRPGGAKQRTCCGTVLNNTSWEFTGKDCPSAEAQPTDPSSRMFSGDDFDATPRTVFTRYGAALPY